MAKIIKTSDQEAALESIVSTLKVLKNLNRYLEEADPAKESLLSVTTGKAKVSAPFETSEIRKILNDYRKNAVSKVRTLSKRHSIVLDEDDEAVLRPEDEPEKAVRPSQKKQTKEPALDAFEEKASEDNALDAIKAEFPDQASLTSSEEETAYAGFSFSNTY